MMLTGRAFAAAADCSERKVWPSFAAGSAGWLGWLSVVYSADPSSPAHMIMTISSNARNVVR
jgi:hypothetical protein